MAESARALPSRGVPPMLSLKLGRLFPVYRFVIFPLSQWRCNLHSHGSGSIVQFQNSDSWETSSVGTNYWQQLSRVLQSHSCQRLAVLLVMPSLWGRVKRPIALIVQWLLSEMRRYKQLITIINYCLIRNAIISLLSVTIEGAYYSSFILVSSVRVLYQEVYLVS